MIVLSKEQVAALSELLPSGTSETSTIDGAPFDAAERAVLLGTQMVSKGHHFSGVALAAVVDADEIIVLKAGRIEERGTHQALLRRDGWYAAQWRYQQLEASLEAA